jgi:hypothetical protein
MTQIANSLIQSDSEDGYALQTVGLALNDAGDLPRCQTVLEMAQLLVPLNASAELALAECYVATKDADLAVDCWITWLVRNLSIHQRSCELLHCSRSLAVFGKPGWLAAKPCGNLLMMHKHGST